MKQIHLKIKFSPQSHKVFFDERDLLRQHRWSNLLRLCDLCNTSNLSFAKALAKAL